MKSIFKHLILLMTISSLFILKLNAQCAGNADLCLSNLAATTTVGSSLIPGTDNSKDLGSSTKQWKDIYLSHALYLDGNIFLDNDGPGTSTNTYIGNTGVSGTSGTGNSTLGYTAGDDLTNGASNTFIGAGSGANTTSGSTNVFVGRESGETNIDGSRNVFVGYQSGNKATGTGSADNVFVGYQAGFNLTNGNHCTFVGKDAGRTHAGAIDCSFFGYQAGYNSNANSNSFFGYSSGYNTTSGGDNTFLGWQSGYNNTTGTYNTFVGNYTGNHAACSTETSNTFIGYNCGSNSTTGSENTLMGHGAGGATNSAYNNCTAMGFGAAMNGAYSNSMALGNGAAATASNYVYVGNGAVTFIGGAVAWSPPSDSRFKTNIKSDVPGLEFINRLNPVTYNFEYTKFSKFRGETSVDYEVLKQKEGKEEMGLIAQDVESVCNEMGFNVSNLIHAPENESDNYALAYSQLVVPLIKAVQELSQENDAMKGQIAQLQAEIVNDNGFNNGSVKFMIGSEAQTLILGQNIPNPYDESTIIPFRVPVDCNSASILISDMNGKIMSAIPIACNETHVIVEAGVFSAGTYSYSLFVDGKTVDTKQMILAK